MVVAVGAAFRQRGAVSAPLHAAAGSSLVRAAREGDRDAFAELYRRYARMVHGIVLALVPRRDVDDLVQDVFLRALHELRKLRDPAAFGAWLARIARRRAGDYHRRAKDALELPEGLAAVAGAEAEARAVLAVIQGLPETYRETLVLRLVEGMTGPEIAERTGLTHGSVRVNLHRGMKLLRERLGEVRQP